jgi:hypothetical protein
MRISKLNTVVLALIFSVLVEGISIAVYRWASAFSPDTFEDTLCDLYLVVHMPALKLTQIFYPPGHWPGIGADILFYVFALCECWLLALAAIWSIRHFRRKSA